MYTLRTLACRAIGLFFALLIASAATAAEPAYKIEKLDPPLQGFFSKRIVTSGIPVLAHADVSDAGLIEAARRVDRLLSKIPDVQHNLVAYGMQLQVIGKDQQVTDLPQYRHMKGVRMGGRMTMDERGRGYGGLWSSCAEENLLKLPSDRYKDHRDIGSHEFSHGILEYGLSKDIREKIEAQRLASVAAGKWKGMYAGTNTHEFFAELTMWYLGSRGDYGRMQPAPQEGAEWFRKYDPEAYALIDSIYTGKLKSTRTDSVMLKAHPEEAAASLRPGEKKPEVELVIANNLAEPLKLFTIGADGQRRPAGEVRAGSFEFRRTVPTCPWVVENGSGKVLGVYVAEAKIGRIDLYPQASTPPAAPPAPPAPARE